MKRYALIAIVSTMFLVSGGVLPVLCGGMDDVRPSLVYGAYVDDYIRKCEAKMDMLDSRSLHIRKDAMRSTIKGAFMKSNRSALITYLAGKSVPFNADRVQYHLNQKFLESVHPRKVYAALSDTHIDQENVIVLH